MSAVRVQLATRPTGVVENTAAADVASADLATLRYRAETATNADVDRALRNPHPSTIDFAALLSAQALERLEELAEVAHRTTLRRFGRTIRLFAPLYLSNVCVSNCTYCGFSAENDIVRRTLDVDEVREEARVLAGRGFRHLLLVSGEHARIVSKDYLVECVRGVAGIVPQVSLEVQVWDTETYSRLLDAGCDGIVAYQETYDRDTYSSVHLKGKKRNYDWRLGAPDRAAEAGMRRLGIGALLGLHDDWRFDAIALATHAHALMKRRWRCEISCSLPRLRPAAGDFEPADPVDDTSFVQLICALRVALPDVGITMSTREAPALRDALMRLGVTQMSAGSHTEPGGYAAPSDAEPQFEIADVRSVEEVVGAVRASGYDTVWKDWQRV